MLLEARVISKVETESLPDEEGETKVNYQLHLKLSINRESLEAQGGGILASVKVSEQQFATVKVGETISFEGKVGEE